MITKEGRAKDGKIIDNNRMKDGKIIKVIDKNKMASLVEMAITEMDITKIITTKRMEFTRR
jgi:hypothetical protein